MTCPGRRKRWQMDWIHRGMVALKRNVWIKACGSTTRTHRPRTQSGARVTHPAPRHFSLLRPS